MSANPNPPQPTQPPTVTSVNPNKGYQGQQNKIVTITGINLIDVQIVSFGPGIQTVKVTAQDDTTIIANISIAPNAALGSRDVSVTTKAGADTLAKGFTVLDKELPDIPQRKDADYGKRVLEVSVSREDVAAMASDPTNKELFKEELITCDRLVSDWGDCSQVVQDCKELIESAHVEVNKGNGDLIGAHNNLWQVRQRLVQAWHAQQVKKRKVFAIFVWLILTLGVCIYLLIWKHLLPGETPRVTEPNVAALYASFLFGAIGGIFDALSACSKHYTDQTFDSEWWPWYLCSPFLGAILGAVVFAAFLAGLLVTTGSGLPASENTAGNTTADLFQNLWGNMTTAQQSAVQSATSDTAEPSARAALILVFAFIAGFKQIAVINFLERIAKSVFGEGEE